MHTEQFEIKVRKGDTESTETVEVQVNLEGIAEDLGRKAVRSAGGVAREASGLIRVRHLR